MIPEIGHFALILALCVSVVQGTLPLIGAAKNSPALMSVAGPAAQAQFAFIGIAFACLVYAFVGNDFSVINVARNSNSNLPLFYRIAASWGSHEGSMLLWVTMLAAWGLAVSIFSARLPEEMLARVLGVMGCIAVGFHLFLLLTSNPFERLLPAAPDGRDLNPLLQDPGMVFHPPLLYMGYVGFSVAFAFAIAALLGGRLDAVWARWSRPWTTAAWCSLTLGIALGSWWAYYELGWGGWWFWDPVENASFMPWLVGTALMHSLAVTEKRGSFKSWTVLLAIVAFALSLLGTFIVRSGILTSVHAFATDPKRGIFILAFLVIVIGLSLTVYAWRAPKVGTGGAFALVSRESLLLVNNVLLVVASASVLLGTLYGLKLNPREVPSPLIDKPAPAFRVPQLHAADKTITPEDMRGKVWLLNVWASWCAACRQEHPLLVEFARRNVVPIVGLSYKDRREDGLAWLKELGDPYVLSAFDLDGRVGIDYGVYGVPETFLIDKAGIIRHKHIGPLTPEALERTLLPKIRELSGA